MHFKDQKRQTPHVDEILAVLVKEKREEVYGGKFPEVLLSRKATYFVARAI